LVILSGMIVQKLAWLLEEMPPSSEATWWLSAVLMLRLYRMQRANLLHARQLVRHQVEATLAAWWLEKAVPYKAQAERVLSAIASE